MAWDPQIDFREFFFAVGFRMGNLVGKYIGFDTVTLY